MRINIIRGTDFHRILLVPGEEAWTLFIHGPRTKGWGFLLFGGYVAAATNAEEYSSKNWRDRAPKGAQLRAGNKG